MLVNTIIKKKLTYVLHKISVEITLVSFIQYN